MSKKRNLDSGYIKITGINPTLKGKVSAAAQARGMDMTSYVRYTLLKSVNESKEVINAELLAAIDQRKRA